jgi:hypothetical protein
VSSDVLTLLLKSAKPTKETTKERKKVRKKERKQARMNRVREKQFLRKENSVYKRLDSGLLVGQVGKINKASNPSRLDFFSPLMYFLVCHKPSSIDLYVLFSPIM